ncbi:MAG: hypothetical protein UV57_C0041G0011 [Parcubacteria group bacterium GW2011_GWD2_43_10]|uniref:Uncharacterized protein n=5 Tax=Candidatus Vebleniibacteriota TaxID=1817921 RepID=A0A1G2Q8C5_9BACT|nr:MAG: hypothetical protein UV47_C0009G0011 [Parcubacteria group bacterium GW2011_GWA2_42_80]KKS77826.1 MAG: hypothetical protein UV52_C0044G0004 [Parcubacteria group bacterium GW2011_GWD1_42_9]KKS81707.1 MAG: hypothetical protein UV57_C0041G0011 [Parcubacteria group bacterium GW2011_GWD2_43_10]KKS93842.1 MAG: hypothetical protein UV69_C0003G0013 [Parcubacteria group bacterium GW2011_GWE2_43_12]KKT13462.1 MAG: hypothetical protein UV92_C0014G0012 [Parcubacteria group bacterium GW2011_GWA1_43_2
MRRSSASPYYHKSLPNKYSRLSILILCLLLTIAFTAFSIWYNLNKSNNSEPGLFDYIGQKFQEGFESNNRLINN